MTIPVVQKSYKPETPNKGYWDYAFVESLLRNELWNPVDGFAFEFLNNFEDLYNKDCPNDGAIVMIPARYHADKVAEINRDINTLNWVLLVLVGDEDGTFPTEQLVHLNMKVWLMLPHGPKKGVDRYLPNGWPTGMREFVLSQKSGNHKDIRWFFSGQVTHSRRVECVKALESMIEVNTGELYRTDGFTKGLPQQEYWKKLIDSKIVPCPSGAVVPESFRFYEALECGCLPIVDAKSPVKNIVNFWQLLFGESPLPFPIIEDWKELPGTIAYFLDTFPKAANATFAWWQQQKREWAYNLRDDIMTLMQYSESNHATRDKITVLIPTSYISIHPDTSIIDETIQRVREHLPDSEIIIMFDGIRDEQKQDEAKYEEYKRIMLHKCNTELKNVMPVIFETHTHQAGMTRKALDLVKTPLILFVEHDTPICEEIPFLSLIELIEQGQANMIRLHHEALILAEHKHLMLDQEPIVMNGIPVVRTGQWSQRPHLSSKEFYRQVLDRYFSQTATTMIEDRIIGYVQQAFLERGQVGWNEFKLMIYAPTGDMKRSYHLDGRGKEPKYEETFKY